jgi:predicted glycoside hydrolase/deacetylase ChbG (UPF0249 family)
MSFSINADDFGLSRSINQGIIHSFESRIIQTASISINGSDCDYAVDYLTSAQNNKVGIHITLVGSEVPVSSNLRYLVGSNGQLLSRNLIFLKAFFNKNVFLEIYTESKAQIEKALNLNFEITHLDSHQHLHINPLFHKIFIRLCREFNIPKLRTPRSINKFKRYGVGNVVNLFSTSLHSKALINHLSPYNSFGFDFSGKLDVEALKLLSKLNHENFEIMAHPGFSSDDTIMKYGHWKYKWELEIKSLKQFLEC